MPVMPGYAFSDQPHEKTIQPAGFRYSCHSDIAGPGPRGAPTTIVVQTGWYETTIEGQPVRLPTYRHHTTDWLEKLCGTTYPPVMGPCAGCANNQLQPPT